MSDGTLVFPKYMGKLFHPSLDRLPQNEGDFYEVTGLKLRPPHSSKHQYIVYKRGAWEYTNTRPEPYDASASYITRKYFRVMVGIWLLLVGALIACSIPLFMELPLYASMLSLGVIGGAYLAGWVVLIRSPETY